MRKKDIQTDRQTDKTRTNSVYLQSYRKSAHMTINKQTTR